MKSEITSLDLHFLAIELQELVGSKVDKIYEQEAQDEDKKSEEKKDFLFVFHKAGTGKLMLRIKLPSLVYLTKTKQEFPENPPGFCMFLRKYLGNSRIIAIRQRGFERILEMEFENKEGKLLLVSELFSKGNMVLVDAEGKIKGLLESQNWQSRVIRGGTKYEYPPSQSNPKQMTEDEIAGLLRKSKLDSIVKSIAIELGFGGLYSEEVCRRAGIDKNSTPGEAAEKAALEIKRLFHETISPNKSGSEVMPFISEGFVPEITYATFNDALDANFSPKIEGLREQKKQKEAVSKRSKITTVIEKQVERLKALEDSSAESQRKGEIIYEHYSDIQKLLEMINEDRKRMSWEEIKKKYAPVKAIKAIDEKKGQVTLDLE